ncbi:MAG: helix-turn-helix domain-containing protein [Candidatus Accumulibacter sp.]|uniref:helix-turn-helix domain-containing protein n=1 Tax=Accumulibacter sp. TaxID=2053492 RepID=UPI001A397924|nr:helix-turn-helix domain-containing protein [Accumulibacter sp.]MBL8396160.1 helix-turn-helix domain-containing protein [Accumulibacter sp.]
MHPELIKAQLRMHGSSPADVARETGVSQMNVSHVIRSRHRSVRIARRICELTGLEPDTAWPGRYPEFRFDPIRFPQTPHFQEVA